MSLSHAREKGPARGGHETAWLRSLEGKGHECARSTRTEKVHEYKGQTMS
jgi:hypothetical protein